MAGIQRLARVAAVIAAAVVGNGAPGRGADATPALAHERRTMTLRLAGRADEAFPLFGPVREAEWSPQWAPRFIAPAAPAQGPDGAVFVTHTHHGESVWVMTTYDTATRRVAYVVSRPGDVVCEIRVHVTPADAPDSDNRALAEVEYRYTALSAAGNQTVEHWARGFPAEAPHWETALNRRLRAIHADAGR